MLITLNDGKIPKVSEQIGGIVSKPNISVLCHVFNQELYVEQCLDSILEQRTYCSVEIIVHDDASTDGTVKILEEYSERYPDIIKLVLQNQNQFSRGNAILALGLDQCNGDYIAFCHGDDYWISNNKLQLQYDILSKNEVGVVGNPSLMLDSKSNEIVGVTGFFSHDKYTFKYKDVLKKSGNVVPY